MSAVFFSIIFAVLGLAWFCAFRIASRAWAEEDEPEDTNLSSIIIESGTSRLFSASIGENEGGGVPYPVSTEVLPPRAGGVLAPMQKMAIPNYRRQPQSSYESMPSSPISRSKKMKKSCSSDSIAAVEGFSGDRAIAFTPNDLEEGHALVSASVDEGKPKHDRHSSRPGSSKAQHDREARHRKIRFKDGSAYEGATKSDGVTFHGNGTFVFANGATYTGKYKDGRKHGQGNLETPDGDRYTGEFADDKMHGQGVYVYSEEGGVYRGEFRNDVRQ